MDHITSLKTLDLPSELLQVLDLEQQQSEMSLKVETRDNVRSSPSKDYAEFQNINIKLQVWHLLDQIWRIPQINFFLTI